MFSHLADSHPKVQNLPTEIFVGESRIRHTHHKSLALPAYIVTILILFSADTARLSLRFTFIDLVYRTRKR